MQQPLTTYKAAHVLLLHINLLLNITQMNWSIQQYLYAKCYHQGHPQQYYHHYHHHHHHHASSSISCPPSLSSSSVSLIVNAICCLITSFAASVKSPLWNAYMNIIEVCFIKISESFSLTRVYRVWTFYLSRGGLWHFRTSSKWGSGHFKPPSLRGSFYFHHFNENLQRPTHPQLISDKSLITNVIHL